MGRRADTGVRPYTDRDPEGATLFACAVAVLTCTCPTPVPPDLHDTPAME